MLMFILLIDKSRFDLVRSKEVSSILKRQGNKEKRIVREADLFGLPKPIARWVRNSGVIGQSVPKIALIKQSGQLRLKPDKEDWMRFHAEQVVGLSSPSFTWKVNTRLHFLIRIVGRDFFNDRSAALEMRLNNLLPVAKRRSCQYLHQSALARFMMEMVWYPAFATDSRISWQAMDDRMAKARLRIGKLCGEVIFEVDEEGNLVRCLAERYYDSGAKPRAYWCIGNVHETGYACGVKIPTKMEITWKLDDGAFNWFKVKVESVEYL